MKKFIVKGDTKSEYPAEIGEIRGGYFNYKDTESVNISLQRYENMKYENIELIKFKQKIVDFINQNRIGTNITFSLEDIINFFENKINLNDIEYGIHIQPKFKVVIK
jgi:hypothetical protein